MIKVLFIGNKARQGKDTFALGMSTMYNNCRILHFADEVKREVMNSARVKPLLKVDSHRVFILQNDGTYDIRNSFNDEIANKLEIELKKRSIEAYWGMDGNGYDIYKDPIMLQLWGTDYRRSLDDRYWVNIIKNKIIELSKDNKDYLVMVPDTRFENELLLKQELKDELDIDSLFVKVEMYTKDLNRILDKNRDSNHQSEIELDDVTPDIKILNIFREDFDEGDSIHLAEQFMNVISHDYEYLDLNSFLRKLNK